MKDLYPLPTHHSIGLTRFDGIVVMIVATVLALIAAPNRSPSLAPPGEQTLNRDGIEDTHWVTPPSMQPGRQTEIRSLTPSPLLGEAPSQPPQVLMVNTHIAQWSYHSPDLGTGTRVTTGILGL
jgi:hypothetical protein